MISVVGKSGPCEYESIKGCVREMRKEKKRPNFFVMVLVRDGFLVVDVLCVFSSGAGRVGVRLKLISDPPRRVMDVKIGGRVPALTPGHCIPRWLVVSLGL